MENATQFVHGTPKLAASHRTYRNVNSEIPHRNHQLPTPEVTWRACQAIGQESSIIECCKVRGDSYLSSMTSLLVD
jgi:hypothetical protein